VVFCVSWVALLFPLASRESAFELHLFCSK